MKLDAQKRGILYIETGEAFRHFFGGGSYSAKLANEIYERDERQPDFLAVRMWGDMLIDSLGEDTHLVFDGVARSRPESEMLTSALKFYKRERVTVIYINVSRKWSETRLLARGRHDDVNLSKIDKRLDWFDKDVMPAIEYFKQDPLYQVIEINGEQPIDKVHADIIAKYEYSAD